MTVNLVGDTEEVVGIVAKLAGVAIDDDKIARIGLDPFLIAIVEAREIIDADALFVVTSTLGNLGDEVRDGGTDINQKIRQLDETHHQVEEFGIVLEVTIGHESLVVKVGRKDAGILKDGAVLDNNVLGLGDFDNILEALAEEIDLQVEGPAVHVGIVVGKIGIVVNRLEVWRPAITFGEHFGECGLATTDVSGNCDMHRRPSPGPSLNGGE